jgi:hypothetical protein
MPILPRTLARLPIALSGVSRVDKNDRASALQEQSAGLGQDELGLLNSQVPGHRWNGWCRLTGDEGYYAACSCGWRSTDAGELSPMLRQVNDHLDAVRRSLGWRPSTRSRDKSGPGVGRTEIVYLYQRARALRATARGGQSRLSRSLSHSADLLSASAEQADLLVTELERRRSASNGASTSNATFVQHKVERARELRRAIVAAAAALAVITEEIAEIHPETSREKAIDWIYGERATQPQ